MESAFPAYEKDIFHVSETPFSKPKIHLCNSLIISTSQSGKIIL